MELQQKILLLIGLPVIVLLGGGAMCLVAVRFLPKDKTAEIKKGS